MKSLLVILLIVLLFAANSISQNWPTVGGNNQRNGLTEMFGPDSVVSPFWTVMSNNLSLWGNSVFISGNKFVTSRVNFTPSYTAILECRDIYSGDKLWEKKVYPGSIMYAVGFNEDAVYAHDYSNDTLYALSPYDGSVLWAVKENMFGGNSGITFACNGDPIVKGRRLDKFTGETIWFYDYIVPIGPNSGYAIYGNTFYHFTGSIVTDKKIIALDLETGNLKYESPALPGDSDQEYPITIGNDGTIYLFRDGGNLFAFTDNGSGLNIKWIYDPVGSAVPGYFGSDKNGNIYIVDNDTVKKLSSFDGRVLAKSNVPVMAGFNATITVDGEGKVFICNSQDAEGKYYCFSSDLQTLYWEYSRSRNYYCGPALGKEGILIIIGEGQTISSFKPNKPFKPIADFYTDSSGTRIFAGESINFFDNTSFNPTSWQWYFEGADNPYSSEQNPVDISYSNPGIYSVTLAVSNSLGVDTLTKSCYILVEPSVGLTDKKPNTGSYKLEQNYPNPFNPVTKIRYQINKSEFIQLKVFDVLGNEVRTLVNGEKQSGSYEVQFDAEELSSGIYYYRLTGYNFSESKKMILVK